jgi:hypothetical protein
VTGQLYIGGEWRESSSGRTCGKNNPWRPDEVSADDPATEDAPAGDRWDSQ